ncbi:PREDICTED: uncharacterized protein LOC104755841 [Camelina sativa]|uniref:Uncharacterized protein LOC104755841 n=1 Tax=Camelina sativa TaxID=90675 RepID=A0ABM1R5W9_CAMSA|nr:PREDICTED: uncharacterized protein LOC104755841 [Camelina sativa]
MEKAKATKETAAVPVTFFWDIKRFPVGPCIKQNLRKLGYTGPITITAIGVLPEVSLDILESLSSTGIAFKNLAKSPRDALGIFIDFYPDAPSPANIMFLSAPPAFTLPIVETHISEIRNDGYYTTFLFARNSQDEKCLWLTNESNYKKSRLTTESKKSTENPGALEEGDKSSETSKPSFWDCFVCTSIRGYGFQNFLTHLSTRHHKRMLSYWNSYAKPGDSESDSESDSDSDVKAPITYHSA